MFLEHFGLIEQPFGVTPDPRFLHLGQKHREALASIIYATEANRGFVALIGPPGMGKTSLLFQYLEGMRHKGRTVFLFQSAGDSRDLMRYILTDLGIDASSNDLPGMHERMNEILMEEMRAGRRFVLVIDEAQNLGEDVLESVRLLSNFETPWAKLMEIVLAGQPQLAERLARPSMAQLRQRISSVVRIDPFTAQETNIYIDHRLWVSGYAGASLFTAGARSSIAEHSGGIPRNINNLCFQSMSLACAMGKKQVDSQMVQEVIADLAIESLPAIQPGALGNKEPYRPLSASLGTFGKTIPVIVSASVMLLLGIVSGVFWETRSRTKPFDVTPSVEAAVFPASVPTLAPQATPAEPAVPPTAEAADVSATSSPDVPTAQKPGDRVLTVVVEDGVTLRHLSLRYLNRFDPRTLAEIHSLNPGIADPDRIEAGQRIRLPLYLRRNASRGIQPAAGLASSRPAEE